MRSFSESEQSLLRVMEQFNRVEKYQGITPEEFLVSFRKKDIEALLDDEILEKAKLKSFSHRVKGLRFTPKGRQIWQPFTGEEEPGVIISQVGWLVRDVFLQTRLSYSEEAVPKSHLLKYHSKATLLEAYEMGLIAKVKIKQTHRDVVKGFMVTGAGYAFLKGNNYI